MINLIRNELKKIFSKTSTYIIFITVIVLLIGVNLLNRYAFDFDNDPFNIYLESSDEFERELAEIEKSGFMGTYHSEDEWFYLKTEVEQIRIINMIRDDKSQSWKTEILRMDETLLPTQNEVFNAQLLAIKTKNEDILNSKEYKEILDKYNEEVNEFITLTETEYTEIKMSELSAYIENLFIRKNELEKVNEKDNINKEIELNDLLKEVKIANNKLENLELRKEKNISYDPYNYLNKALNDYEFYKTIFDEPSNFSDDNSLAIKKDYYLSLKYFKEAEYILETGKDINNPLSANVSIRSFLGNNVFLYLIIIIVVAGNIVAEEFTNGTIKNLLIKPYKRVTILFSKLTTVLLFMIITFFILLIAQLIISVIVFDFNTITEPVVEYNISAETIKKCNLFIYVIKDFVHSLPNILVFTLFTFALSTILTSSAAAITLGMISVLATDVTNQLLLFSTAKWIKYIPTLNWNWKEFLGVEYHKSYGINPIFAIGITLITYIVFLVPAFIVFKKRDIKNI